MLLVLCSPADLHAVWDTSLSKQQDQSHRVQDQQAALITWEEELQVLQH